MSYLKVEFQNFILQFTLLGEQSGNSFGPAEAEVLSKALSKLPPHTKGILFKAASFRFFCTGGNLQFYSQQTTAKQGILANRKIKKALEQLSNTTVPTAVAVTGDCFGGGMELLSCFDYVVAEPHILLGFWQRKIGLIFGWGGGSRLLQRMSKRQLKSYALSCKNISAYEAVQKGLVDQVSRPQASVATAMKWLQAQSKLTSAPVASLKILNEKNESRLFETLWFNPEHKEILKLFKNKNSK